MTQSAYAAIAVQELAVKQLKIESLKEQIQFLLDTFTTRDAMQRTVIKQQEGVMQQQALQLTWFQAHTSDGPLGLTQ